MIKKLYTTDHQRLITCSDFERKFGSFLDFVKKRDAELYASLVSQNDLEVHAIQEFKILFETFLHDWLKQVFNYSSELSVDKVDSLLSTVRMTDQNYDEFFTYFNLFKMLRNAEQLFIYDLNVTEEEATLLQDIAVKSPVKRNQPPFSTNILVTELIARKFMLQEGEDLTLSFKGRQVH